MGIFQRVLRVNAGAKWPVHWSSLVAHADRITRKYPDSATPGFGPGQYIQAINGVIFGKNIRMGPGVKIISADHNTQNFAQHLQAEPIVIGDNCWLGANCIVLPGVVLGEHTIVGAGAVVTASIPQGNCVVAGVPARIVKTLPPYTGSKPPLEEDATSKPV